MEKVYIIRYRYSDGCKDCVCIKAKKIADAFKYALLYSKRARVEILGVTCA